MSDLKSIVDLERYPLIDSNNPAYSAMLSNIHTQLTEDGCCVLPGFITPDATKKISDEGSSIADTAYHHVETVNAYNTDIEQSCPADHPAAILFERGNAFVARDRIPSSHFIQQLYTASVFKQFLADCFEVSEIHELADPLAGLCLNVVSPGRTHPWHFDTNEFTVSLLTQRAESGGVFEYCPDIRSPQAENFDRVKNVLTGDRAEVKQLDLQCGDLQLFKGRYSLHRVTTVNDHDDRHTSIFAYTKEPGIMGKAERSRQLFGRTTDAHHAHTNTHVRSDNLMD
jgi:hypothetical protein